MAYKDLRDWLEQVDRMGELKRLDGVDWNVQAGAVASMTSDAVLLDNFAGYPSGYRVLGNQLGSITRWLLALNWSTKARGNDLCREFKDRLLHYKPIPPRWVKSGPIQENIQEGKDIDIFKFPVPKIHPEDAGRYIGSADAVIVKDPDTGMVNLGVYRVQVHDKKTLGLHASQGKDGDLIIRKYHRQGKPCPVVVLVGQEPVVYRAAGDHVTHADGNGEYEFAGWLKGEPIDVIKGEFTGLPIPASAEIAIEGEIPPGVTRMEGPFGEWTGYSIPREDRIIPIHRVLHRDNPILTLQSPSVISRIPKRLHADPRRSSFVWQELEQAGVREVKGVAVYSRFLVVVCIKNSYAGHSRQAGYIAAQCHAGAYLGRFVIVVDEDIDPYNIDQVIWSATFRANPERAIDIVRYCWSSAMDPAISIEARGGSVAGMPVYNSRCIIDACKPIEWDPLADRSVVYDEAMKDEIMKRWGNTLYPGGKPKEVSGWSGLSTPG